MSKNLAVWLSEYAMKLNDFHLKAMTFKDYQSLRSFVSLEFPVIQGTKNQMDLRKVGQLDCDHSRLAGEVEDLLDGKEDKTERLEKEVERLKDAIKRARMKNAGHRHDCRLSPSGGECDCYLGILEENL